MVHVERWGVIPILTGYYILMTGCCCCCCCCRCRCCCCRAMSPALSRHVTHCTQVSPSLCSNCIFTTAHTYTAHETTRHLLRINVRQRPSERSTILSRISRYHAYRVITQIALSRISRYRAYHVITHITV